MSTYSDDLVSEFLAESLEALEKVNTSLDQILTSENKKELAQVIFRGIHTVKGGSGMFDYTHTKQTAHQLENYLEKFKTDPHLITEADVAYIRNELQVIETLLKSKDQPQNLNELQVKPAPERGLVSATTSTSSAVSAPLPAPTPSPGSHSTTSSGGTADEFIRVSVNKVNEMLNGVGEIFLARNQMTYLLEKYKAGTIDRLDLIKTWDQLDTVIRRGIGDIERIATGMRMMTIQSLFSRMARVVQRYEAETHKKILIQTHGENTELDKKVLDALYEPLIHLVRNAMDHGVEPPDDRNKANKPEAGTIRLSASILGNEAVIDVEDDGRGMDPKKITQSAKSKGIDVSHVNDDKTALELIFLPGFSTAAAVTETSGRGVGMDAVKSSIAALGGRIQIQTKLGQGTRFTIRIPVSMSLLSAILVNINGHLYAIPNQDIIETRLVHFEKIKTNGDQHFLNFRNDFIPCIDLRKNLPLKRFGHEEFVRECAVILFNHESHTLACRVSCLEKNLEIIVKPLPTLSPKMPYLSGVTVLPTGEPAFVISVGRLYDFITKKGEPLLVA